MLTPNELSILKNVINEFKRLKENEIASFDKSVQKSFQNALKDILHDLDKIIVDIENNFYSITNKVKKYQVITKCYVTGETQCVKGNLTLDEAKKLEKELEDDTDDEGKFYDILICEMP